MSRTLFLHCGPFKTGTSAFQAHVIQTSPDAVLYPVAGRWHDGAHHRITFALEGKTTRGVEPLEAPDTVLSAVQAEIDATDRDVLISSESLLPGTAELLVSTFSGFDAVQLIIAIRHPLERAASMYNQSVKDPVSAEHRWPETFLKENARLFTTRHLVEKWTATGFPITWVNYHPAETATARLCDAAGLPPPDDVPRANRSVSGFALAGLLAANRLRLAAGPRGEVFAHMRKHHGRQVWHGHSFPFARWASRAFLQDVAAPDLEWTLETLGLDVRGLITRPPAPFGLNEEEIQKLESCFEPVTLTPGKSERLRKILERFQRRAKAMGDTA